MCTLAGLFVFPLSCFLVVFIAVCLCVCLTLAVRPQCQIASVTGELTASGASKSVQAFLSSRTGSEFYNARLMVWEPLVEPWEARLELEAGTQSTTTGAVALATATATAVEDLHHRAVRITRGGGGEENGIVPSDSASGRQNQGLAVDGVSGTVGGRKDDGSGLETVSVKVRLVSEQTMNVNLTESLVENVAAITTADRQQRQGPGGTGRADVVNNGRRGDGAGISTETFSLRWVRNEAGIDVRCSPHHDMDTLGNSGVVAEFPSVDIAPGEELPMPLSGLPLFSSSVDDDDHANNGGGGDGGGDGDGDGAITQEEKREIGPSLTTYYPDAELPPRDDENGEVGNDACGIVAGASGRSAAAAETSAGARALAGAATSHSSSTTMSLSPVPPIRLPRPRPVAEGLTEAVASYSSFSFSSPTYLSSRNRRRLSATSMRNSSREAERQRRVPRVMMLEFEDSTKSGMGAAEARAGAGSEAATTTRWRSLRPIQADVVGQRLTTMVDIPEVSRHRGDGATTTAIAGEGVGRGYSRTWRRGSWARSMSRSRFPLLEGGCVVDTARGTRTIKMVTEVESHHGVKVSIELRVTSLRYARTCFFYGASKYGCLRL